MTINPDSAIATPLAIQGFVERLEDWQTHLQQQEIKRRLRLGDLDSPDRQLLKDLRLLQIESDLATTETVGEVIKAIKLWLKSAPVLHLTFSTQADRHSQTAIIDWLHQQINPSVLVEFTVDGSIAAGFVVRTKNHLYNFTANEALWRSRRKLGELVQHV